LGFALQLAAKAPGALHANLVHEARGAFVHGMHHAVIVGALAATIGAFVVAKWLPALAGPAEAFEEQDTDKSRSRQRQG
jgi:hypothetical protein